MMCGQSLRRRLKNSVRPSRQRVPSTSGARQGIRRVNDLDIDPDDEDARDELKEQSLVLLYRLIFVLYAESRGLIDPDDPAASEEYQEYFSLEAKREEIIDDVEGLDVRIGHRV